MSSNYGNSTGFSFRWWGYGPVVSGGSANTVGPVFAGGTVDPQ